MIASPPRASIRARRPLEVTLPSRGLSFGHPALLGGIPILLLAALASSAAWVWASAARISAAQSVSPMDPEAGRDTPSLSRHFTPEVLRWEPSILSWSAQWGLDANLVATVMQIESCGDPRAMSSSGALGLFQVMPFHFASGEDPLDAETNARRGVDYLARSMNLAGGRADLALAGYNGGHGVIAMPQTAWSAETRRYVAWGSGILSEIQAGGAQSSTLAAWLAAGGARLCRRADTTVAAAP